MMFVETAIGLGMIGSISLNLTSDYRDKKREIKEIKNKWNELMNAVGSNKVENKIEQKFELVKVMIKHYGFNAIVSLPYGNKIDVIRDMLPSIEQCFSATAILELSSDKNTAYMRLHYDNKEINEIDSIRFKWYRSFFKGDKCRNPYGETFKIHSIEKIYNPNSEEKENNKKEMEKEIVGYKILVKIPIGLNYNKLKDHEEQISNSIDKCLIKWDSDLKMAVCDIMTKKLSDDEKFKPIKPPSPYHFYLAMSYGYNAIMSDLSKNPHLLYTGKSQTGKTVAVMTGITNLAYHYNEDDFILLESMISAKQDLRIFKNLYQCKYYANDIDTSLRLFKYIKLEMYRRNRIFETSKKFVGSMYQWNAKYPKEKMPMILLAIDEMTLYAPIKSDKKEIKSKKEECIDILTQLLIEGASSGINVLFSLQRPDKESLSTQIKGQLGTKIGFYQPNTASSLVAMDDESCSRLELKREAIVKYDKGSELVRTLYLTPEMIEDILKDKICKNKKHLNIDLNGRLVEEKVPESEEKPDETPQKEEEIAEKPKKETRFSQYLAKKSKKEQENAKREAYLREMKEQILKNSIGVEKKNGDQIHTKN